MTTSFQEQTIASLVAENIQYAHVFKQYGIDFCCGGHIAVASAAEKKKIDLQQLLADLMAVNQQKSQDSHAFNTWDLTLLSDYIERVHHRYVAQAIPLLQQYGEKVLRVHGAHHPPLEEITKRMYWVIGELQQHMLKEERILFPYIRAVEHAQLAREPLPEAPFGQIENPIRMMEHEHEQAGKWMYEIAELTEQYVPPTWACNTFKAWYDKLHEFEDDLHLHVHLENNILFPKAIAAVKSFPHATVI